MPVLMMNIIMNRLKKWVHPIHAGTPGVVPEWVSAPGWRWMNACTAGMLCRPLPIATAAISNANPIGISHSRLNHLSRPTRRRGAVARRVRSNPPP